MAATRRIAVLGAIYALYSAQGTTAATMTGFRLAFLGGGIVELTGAAIALLFIRADSMDQRRTQRA